MAAVLEDWRPAVNEAHCEGWMQTIHGSTTAKFILASSDRFSPWTYLDGECMELRLHPGSLQSLQNFYDQCNFERTACTVCKQYVYDVCLYSSNISQSQSQLVVTIAIVNCILFWYLYAAYSERHLVERLKFTIKDFINDDDVQLTTVLILVLILRQNELKLIYLSYNFKNLSGDLYHWSPAKQGKGRSRGKKVRSREGKEREGIRRRRWRRWEGMEREWKGWKALSLSLLNKNFLASACMATYNWHSRNWALLVNASVSCALCQNISSWKSWFIRPKLHVVATVQDNYDFLGGFQYFDDREWLVCRTDHSRTFTVRKAVCYRPIRQKVVT